MKRTTAASLTILAGIALLVGGPAFTLLRVQDLTINTLAMGVGVFLGCLLIAVGVHVRLQSMSTSPAVLATRLCPQCSRINAPTNKYCDKCGTKLSTEES